MLAVPYLLLAMWPLLTFVRQPCPQSKPSPSAQTTPLAPIPDIQQLAAMASGGFSAPTDEQLLEEQQVIAEQIEEAKLWLADVDAKQRISGAEQLSAYPTPEAERLLVMVMKTDPDAGVRSAAAESLAFVKKPKPSSIDALLLAMQDMDEEVRSIAFSTLQTIVNRAETEPKTSKLIFGKLKRLMGKGMVDSDSRDAIREFLQDQEAL